MITDLWRNHLVDDEAMQFGVKYKDIAPIKGTKSQKVALKMVIRQ